MSNDIARSVVSWFDPQTIKDFLPTSYNTLSILRDKKIQNVEKNRIVYFSLTGKYFIGIVFLSIRNILETILGKYFNSNLICWVLQFMRTINWNRAVINGGVANEPKSNLDVWRSWIQQWSNINFQDYLQSSHLRFRTIWFGRRALSDENDGNDGDARYSKGQSSWRDCLGAILVNRRRQRWQWAKMLKRLLECHLSSWRVPSL